MRVSSTLFTVLLSAGASCLPFHLADLAKGYKRSIGSICTDGALGGSCSDLLVSVPNTCMTSKSGALPYERGISSLTISTTQTCAFFQLEACIHPAGTHGMVVKGPITLDTLPSSMDKLIQAYICGAAASTFVPPNITLTPGTMVLDDIDTNQIRARHPVLHLPDGRGATVWKHTNMLGSLTPRDNIAIPGTGYCTDMSQVYGDWDAKIRSLVVAKGYKCRFYTDHKCLTNSHKLELGCKDNQVRIPELHPEWDSKIHSVYCAKI